MTAGLPTTARLRRAAEAGLFSAKRRPVATGIGNWYPYYAGFSDTFAAEVLRAAQLVPDAVVMDPWNGSGTTTHVADNLGYQSLGFDLNPVAVLIANAKLARPADAQYVMGLAKRIVQAAAARGPSLPRSDALSLWLRPSVVGEYRALEAEILANLATDKQSLTLRPADGTLPPLASFLLLALMRAARTPEAVMTGSNPTWVTPPDVRSGERQILGTRWLEMIAGMTKDLLLDSRASTCSASAQLADSRSLPTRDGSVDFVLTSPPYCTRIDYVKSTAFEMAALGLGDGQERFDELRRDSMGTPLARPGEPADPLSTWPESVQTLLERIRRHKSKASCSYYYKTYWQYFRDVELSLRELWRTLRSRGTVALVVQSSYYKEIRVDLPELYADMGRAQGFESNIVQRANVTRALVQINTRSNVYRGSSSYCESLVCLERAE